MVQKKNARIAVAAGDGIGPEIMDAVQRILNASSAQIEYVPIIIGEQMYHQGHRAGIAPEAWEILKSTDAFLKAPITTPQGGGFKSLNVTIRTTLGLYANVRPCITYSPYVKTKHQDMNVVVVRENEEDLYAGIEYQQSPEATHAIKIISRSGCEKIVRYAFEYARAYGRKRVTCFTKDNILKMTDGLFHAVFEEVAKEYSDIENEHWIIDIGAAKLADTPENFDVVVMPNLYGDILSDVTAQIAGSVGLAGSANIGDSAAMFEAIHGSAPRRAGQNLANPSGLLQAAVMMLVHVHQPEAAEEIQNAWLKTMEDGIHTYDIFREGVSQVKVGTKEFADAVIERIGKKPTHLQSVHYHQLPMPKASKIEENLHKERKKEKKIIGCDITIQHYEDVASLADQLKVLSGDEVFLKIIHNRGVAVWPELHPETSCIDQYRCRFQVVEGNNLTLSQLGHLLDTLGHAGIDVLKMENLYTFDGQRGFTASQSEQ